MYTYIYYIYMYMHLQGYYTGVGGVGYTELAAHGCGTGGGAPEVLVRDVGEEEDTCHASNT
jgi:hypothetical protein